MSPMKFGCQQLLIMKGFSKMGLDISEHPRSQWNHSEVKHEMLAGKEVSNDGRRIKTLQLRNFPPISAIKRIPEDRITNTILELCEKIHITSMERMHDYLRISPLVLKGDMFW